MALSKNANVLVGSPSQMKCLVYMCPIVVLHHPHGSSMAFRDDATSDWRDGEERDRQWTAGAMDDRHDGNGRDGERCDERRKTGDQRDGESQWREQRLVLDNKRK